MEKKNIIIISAIGVLVILAAAWFILDPLGSGKTKTVSSQVASQPQAQTPPPAEQPKEEAQTETPKVKKEIKQPGEDEIYIVQKGDTLQKIAMDYYGDTKYWIKIFGANEQEIDWYDNIRPGLELKIPKLN